MKRSTSLALILAAAATLAGGAWHLGWMDRLLDQSDGAIAACESALLDALVSPSSYRRIDAKFVSQGPLTLEEFKEAAETRDCPVVARSSADCESLSPTADALTDQYIAQQQLAKEGSKNQRPNRTQALAALERFRESNYKRFLQLPESEIRTGSVTLTYDAENTFGASLRSSTFCRFGFIGSDGRFVEDEIILFGIVGKAP